MVPLLTSLRRRNKIERMLKKTREKEPEKDYAVLTGITIAMAIGVRTRGVRVRV